MLRADNLLKIAADALKGIVLGDDASVVDATVRKRYSDDPRLRIKVREFTPSHKGVRAGLQRAKREGKRLGRPPIADKLAERIRAALAGGMSVRKTAAKFDVNPSTVQRVAHPFEGADNASVAGAA